MPEAWLRKKKQGFAIPLAGWFRGALYEMLLDTIESRSFRERGVFAQDAVRACVKEHREGRVDHGERLWLILSFELWARRFLDRAAA
jgi:asparagine synthase (glutamine-hydrolysing)